MPDGISTPMSNDATAPVTAPPRYFDDYPNEPIGDGNPYYRCVLCGVSDPEINSRLEGHRKSCAYRLRVEAELAAATAPTAR